MNNWQKLFGGAFLLAILMAAGWFFIRQYLGSITDTNSNSVSNNNTSVVVNTNTQIPVAVNSDEASLRSLGLFFASRFGSYSSASNFSNLKGLDYLLTNNMKAWIENYIQTSTKNLGYYSVITRGLSSNINNRTDNAAEVLIGTQRQEFFNPGGEGQLTYQNLLLKFIKEGEDWKIDSAQWQK